MKKRPGSGYESHKDNYTMSETFRRRMENTQEDVIVALNTGLQERKKDTKPCGVGNNSVVMWSAKSSSQRP